MLPKTRKEAVTMGQLCMDLYLKNLRKRYIGSNKSEKAMILDEFCSTSGYHRKHAIRMFGQKIKELHPKVRHKRGRKTVYEPSQLLEPLRRIWMATDQMCSKRLKSALPIWLPYYESAHGSMDSSIREQLLAISESTIDRLLKPERDQIPRRLCGTKPGSLLKNQIPIKTDQWNEQEPGFVEADLVAHCGTSLMGDFIWSLTLTDIYSGWTENRALWNKGAQGVITQIQNIEENLPFSILGFDCDNGSEFLNHHLIRYFQKRPVPVQFTRSRPYHKNDNAHVEQKNWTHVRQLLGYYRLEDKSLCEEINQVYKNECSLLRNYFYPAMKLIDKQRIKSKIKKIHDKAKTPYQRLMASKDVSKEKKKQLTEVYDSLNPFELKMNLEKKLKGIFDQVDLQLKGRNVSI